MGIVTQDAREGDSRQVWKRSYPRDSVPRNNLGFAYELMGDLEKAAEEYRAAIPLNPLPGLHYQNLARVLLYMDRREEAKAVFDEAIAKKSESTNLHLWLYEFAFERGDAAAMQHEVEWAAGEPDEARMLWEQSAAALFEGKLASAEELMRRANQLAASHNMKGEVAFGTAFLAAQAALFGKCTQASEALPAVKNAPGRDATLMLSAALAICGQNAQAKVLVEEQARRSPTDILLNNVELPLVRALIELNDGNPLRALELLHTTAPYEQAKPRINYVRGMAYLRAGQAAEAASEFQKIAGARGAEPTWPGRALAHLWLARAYALIGDTAKSRKAYEDFFALWKDADADLPLLIDAKKEYQRLK